MTFKLMFLPSKHELIFEILAANLMPVLFLSDRDCGKAYEWPGKHPL